MDLAFITSLIQMLSEKFGILGQITAYILVAIPCVSVLIEVAEAGVLLTASTKDDEQVAKIKAKWLVALKYLELLPHVNVPVAPAIVKAVQMVGKSARAVLAGIKEFKK